MRYFNLAAIGAALLLPAAAYAGETITYKYDAKGRLINVSHTGTVNNGAATSYAYDAADNRTLHRTTGYRSFIVVPLGGLRVLPI